MKYHPYVPEPRLDNASLSSMESVLTVNRGIMLSEAYKNAPERNRLAPVTFRRLTRCQTPRGDDDYENSI